MPARDLALLIDAAHAAGPIAMAHWRAEPEIWTKSDASPVSAADLAVDEALRMHLTAARPDYGWLSEETADTPERLGRRHCFIVDPIDGTRAYLEGQTNWALSLAVSDGAGITAAVIHMPAKDATYAAARGQGATLDGRSIAANAAATLATARMLAPKAIFAADHWKAPVPSISRHFRPSIAYRIALVAEGRFDAMMSLRAAWEWDIAAGALIAAEAGASVTDRNGAALRFNSEAAQTPGILAAPPELHQSLLDAML